MAKSNAVNPQGLAFYVKNIDHYRSSVNTFLCNHSVPVVEDNVEIVKKLKFISAAQTCQRGIEALLTKGTERNRTKALNSIASLRSFLVSTGLFANYLALDVTTDQLSLIHWCWIAFHPDFNNIDDPVDFAFWFSVMCHISSEFA